MTDSKTKKAKEPVYKKLKENQPGFTMNSGKFARRKYDKGVEYLSTDIPNEHKAKFVIVKRVVVQPVAANQSKSTTEENAK